MSVLASQMTKKMSGAWLRFASHYQDARARQGLLLNRTNDLDVQNFFLVLHYELIEEFLGDYKNLERQWVEEGMARGKLSTGGVIRETDEIERDAACWKALVASYSQIHERLKTTWERWQEADYKELLSAVEELIKIQRSVGARAAGAE